MTRLDQRLPEEPLPGFHQQHARACQLCERQIFTDDSIIYRVVKSIADCDQPQQDFDTLYEWETL